MDAPDAQVPTSPPTKFASLFETPEERCAEYRDMPYQAFLETEYWVTIRDHLVEAVGKCQMCSARSALAVHHNTYENHGREHLHLEDLTVVCGRCHMFFHHVQRIPNSLPALYQSASFENFLLKRADPVSFRYLTEVYMSVRAYARDFPKTDRPGLLLLGSPGTGKTHLAAAVFNVLRDRGVSALFCDYQNLAERLFAGARDGSGLAELEACRAADLLFLDDLGSQRPKDWMDDAILNLLKFRCNERKPLIATTNLADTKALPGDQPLDKMNLRIDYRPQLAERIGEAARSRLFEMCKVVVMPSTTPDFRVERA